MSPGRSRGAARDAGAKLERVTAAYLAEAAGDDRIERRVRNGEKDRGDVGGVRTMHGARVVIECKDVKATSLGAWVIEADRERGNDDALVGVVVHKRRGVGLDDPESVGEQFVTCTLADFAALLWGERPTHVYRPPPPPQDSPNLLDLIDEGTTS